MPLPFESIPGPPSLPWIGAHTLLSGSLLDNLPALVDRYGELVRFQLWGSRFLLVASPSQIHEILVEKAAEFPKARQETAIMGRFLGRGLLTNEGASHRRQRKLAQPAFHARRIQGYAETMVSYAQKNSECWRTGEVRNLAEDLRQITLYIVAKTLFNADREMMAEFVDEIGGAMLAVQEISDIDFGAWLSWPAWLPTQHNRRRRQTVKTLDETIERVLAARQSQAVDGVLPDFGDLLSMLLHARDEEGEPMDKQQLRDELVTIFLAGHETTTHALTWTFYLLGQHPKIAAELHDEVDSVLQGRSPTLDDLPRLPSLASVLKEALRLYPPAWMLNTREPRLATTVGGYTVPAQTNVLISPWVQHHLETYFPHPKRFLPARWTPDFEERLPRYAYLPFGGGPRICIGNSFALMEMQLLLATLLQRFVLTPLPDQAITPHPLITLSPHPGLQVHVQTRA